MNRAEIIKFLLNKSNMNISELTREMGVHRTNVYHWRDGITTPKKSTINKLSEILNIPIKWEGKDQVNIVDSPIELIEEKIDMNMDSSKIIALYDENRELRLKLERLKEISNKPKPAYHFKMVSTYKAETDEWLDTDIFGDFSMTGYLYDEIIPIMNEENDNDSWINRYHPDSKKRLCSQTLKDIKTDYHHLTWKNMMWKAKDGTYKCYNIDLLYIRADEKVTSMFYWINGDGKA